MVILSGGCDSFGWFGFGVGWSVELMTDSGEVSGDGGGVFEALPPFRRAVKNGPYKRKT